MSKTNEFPFISVIILNWNGWKDTIECLESVFQIDYPSYAIILVDNGSQDKSIEKIREYAKGSIKKSSKSFDCDFTDKPIKFFEIKEETELQDIKRKLPDSQENRKFTLIKNKKNHGWAKGNNIGMKYALKVLKSEFILVINNDTVVSSDLLLNLVDCFNKVKGKIIGPKVYYYDNKNVIYAAGSARINEKDEGQFGKIKKVPKITGCAIFIKSDVFSDIGLFDEEYFLYQDEVDFYRRAKKAGYDLYFCPCARVWHKEPIKNHLNKPYQIYYNTRNKILLSKKVPIKYGRVEPIISIFKAVIKTILNFSTDWTKFKHALLGIKDGIGSLLSKKLRGRANSIQIEKNGES